MIHAEVPRRRPWVGIIWSIALALGVLLLALQLYAAVVLAFSAALVATFAVTFRPAEPQTRRTRMSAHSRWQPVAQRTIVTNDGVEQAALVAPVSSESGHTMVLTVEGYKLVDDAGRVVYALKR